jgi:hypothetical protein
MIQPIVNDRGEKHSAWVRQSVYRHGIEIGLMKEVPAHSVPVEGNPDQLTHIKTAYYDATLVWKAVEWGTVEINNPQGFAVLPFEMAQQLMDQLWSAGVRPAAAMGSVGQLQATEKHLEDLRTMNGKLLAKVLENPAWIATELPGKVQAAGKPWSQAS